MGIRLKRLDGVMTALDDFRDTELLAAVASDLQAVSLSEGKETVAFKKDERGHWVYTEPKGYGEAESGPDEVMPPAAGQPVKTPGSINTVLTDITALKVEKTGKEAAFVADDVSDFAKYNLDPSKAKVLQIEVTRLEEVGKDDSGKIKTKSSQATLLVGVSKKIDDKSDQYYAALQGEKTVVKVAAKNVEPLARLLIDKGALRDRYLVHMDKTPSALKIKNGFGEFELLRTKIKFDEGIEKLGQPTPDTWTLWRGDVHQAVDPAALQSPLALINVLRQKNIDSFVELSDKPDERAREEAKYGVDKQAAAVVELWNDEDGVVAEDAAEPESEAKRKKPRLKSDKEPTVRLSFGEVVHEGDKKLAYVKRELKGKKDTLTVLVVEAIRDEARKGPLAYLNKSLERFTDAGLPPWKGVTKLAIQRGSTTLEATREEDGKPWVIVKPTDLAGRNAETAKIEGVLGTMNRLIPLRIIAEKAKDDAQLDGEYGLKTPQAQVDITMTKDGKPVTYTYAFGKETPEGALYAKQSQRDTIFTVAKTTLDTLPTDILDPLVFHFDADKLKKVSFTGWQDLTGEPITLELERKDGKSPWEVKKGPKTFKLDEGKVNQLIAELQTCRATRFVALKTGAKPEQKLTLAAGALVIEFTVDGEEKPITLTVGAPDGDKSYFAISNRRDGDVFDLPKSFFEGAKTKPTYFSLAP